MDLLSLTGLVLALFAVLVGAVLKGAGIMALLSAAAFMIVVVGTIAAICIQTPWAVMRRALAIFSWVVRPPAADGRSMIAKIVEWSNSARKQGLLGLEPQIARENDEFVKKVLQLVVDGGEPDSINSVMTVELQSREHADLTAAKVFEGMGVYAPTLGIIGAVLGLMAVLQNLADPSRLGHGIAAKLSQRLGEGVLNGLLTARLGLAAIDVTRPLPFVALPQPALGDLAKDLLRKRESDE